MFSFDIWKLKRCATNSFKLELSTRTTNDKKGLFEKLPTRRENPQAPSSDVDLRS